MRYTVLSAMCSVRGAGCRRARRVIVPGAGPPLAEKREVQQPEHVRRGQKRRYDRDEPEHDVAARERLPENLVLREEPGQRRNARDRDRADEERPVRDGQVLLEPAHVAQVLLAVERVDNGARTEE